MNDTHGETGKGWIGFDLDGTLAKYDGWKGIDHIGEPVKPMVELMKRMHDEGKVVKIMTARVAPRRLEDGTIGEQFTWLTREPSSDPDAKYTATQYIQDWCEKQLGFLPEIVYQKDHLMLELYDDRCHQVEPNTGVLIEEAYEMANDTAKTLTTLNRVLCEKVKSLRDDLDRKEVHIVHRIKLVDIRWPSRLLYVLIGIALTAAAFTASLAFFSAKDIPAAEQKLREALAELSEARVSSRFEKLLYRLPAQAVDKYPGNNEWRIMECKM